jgi:signal transduction histidine kinase
MAVAMRGFCREFAQNQKMEINFQSHDLPGSVPPDLSLCLFRILQEALHNSAKHSGTRHVEVQLFGTSGEIDLTVRDFGAGFEVEAAKQGRGLGLLSMQERIRLVRGRLSIESQLRRGTTIHAQVPLPLEIESLCVAG